MSLVKTLCWTGVSLFGQLYLDLPPSQKEELLGANFNNFIEALITLFVLFSTESYPQIMYPGQCLIDVRLESLRICAFLPIPFIFICGVWIVFFSDGLVLAVLHLFCDIRHYFHFLAVRRARSCSSGRMERN